MYMKALRFLAFLLLLSFNPAFGQEVIRTSGPELGLVEFMSYPQPKAPPISAHRGGGFPGYPENCLESFAHISQQAHVLIECDVRMTADSVLMLMHDASLNRTTTGTGLVTAFNWSDLDSLRLLDSDEKPTEFLIPSLEQTLRWAKANKVILTLDVKRGVPFERVVTAINDIEAHSIAAVITYNLTDASHVYELDSSLLISVGMRNEEEYNWAMGSGIPPRNMIAFTGTRLSDPVLYEKIHGQGILTIMGTMGNLDGMAETKGDTLYKEWQKMGVDIFSTDRPIEAYEALKKE